MINQEAGFTLLEVLIAVSITALIGVGATELLSSTSNTKTATEYRAVKLKNIQRMDMWFKRDISELAGRTVLNVFGSSTEALTTNSDFLVEFTRSGLAPLVIQGDDVSNSSNMQRVAYALRSHDSEYCKDAQKTATEDDIDYNKQCFVRIYWPVLDQSSDTEPRVHVLLDEVENVAMHFRGQLIDFSNPDNTVSSDQWQEDWPGPYITPSLTPDLVQVKLTLTTKVFGEITRLYEVPRYAFTK